MTVTEIIEAFGADMRVFPEEAVRAAIARQEEVTPALLQLVEHAADEPAKWSEDSRIFSTVFALHLLAQFREQRSYRVVIRLAQCPPQYCDAIIGDFVTEGLPRCLASVFDGDPQPIHELIENPHAEEFARAAGVAALKNLVLTGALERTAVLEYFL